MNDNIALKMQQTYNIAYWGGSYYGVNDLGHVTVCPNPEMPQAAVDLAELVNRVQKEREHIRLPALFCFPQILQHRLRSINAAFRRARESYGYKGDYFLVYPIKVNQQRRVIETLVNAGAAGTGSRFQSRADGGTGARRYDPQCDRLQRL